MQPLCRTMNLSTSCNDAIATHSMMQHSSVQPNVKFYCAELWAGTLQLAVSKNIYKQSQSYGEREWTHTMGSEHTPYFDRVRMFKPNESDHTENKTGLECHWTSWKCGTFKNSEKGPMCASNMESPLASFSLIMWEKGLFPTTYLFDIMTNLTNIQFYFNYI